MPSLGTIAKNAVIFVGDPSYTSAVQRWNGTREILNAIPVKKKINARTCMGELAYN
jgi:hypothetical protein